jgi:hypothetical protein
MIPHDRELGQAARFRLEEGSPCCIMGKGDVRRPERKEVPMEAGSPSPETSLLCPSCGGQIEAATTRCPLCKNVLGACAKCGAAGVAGIACLECGGAVRPRAAVAAVEERDVEFVGSPAALVVPVVVRFALSLALAASAVLALAYAGVPVPRDLTLGIALDSAPGVAVFAGGAVACALAIACVGDFLRRYRLRNTKICGGPVEIQQPGARRVVRDLLHGLWLVGTAGISAPWVYNWNLRAIYRHTVVVRRSGRPMDFGGTGEQALRRMLLSILLLPLAVGTAGLLAPLITWTWLRWEHAKMRVPSRAGVPKPVAFTGTFGAYFGRAFVGRLLTLVSLGLYRPWAIAREWRWAADQVRIP